ncbi:SGNH/GDSL hydrolase family protein [Streptomyces sp. CRN 30]|uniref:SGNH/GDSL hydrolase family protein n=1 Tax=Streptomyces sp. CRN 30 TaxID=3075613 RepID=UPI002A7FDECC|nr:SGNH/GDSL hydrolase family protein [Streptomyces sp. CRN 30]
MRGPWIVGLLLAASLLGACGDPVSDDGAVPPKREPAPTVVRSRGAVLPPEASASRDASNKAGGSRTKAPVVLYLGDSLAVENQQVLGRELRDRAGARYRSAPYPGTALCDYLEGPTERSLVPARDKAAALVRATRPDYVVLQFWGNAWGYTPCMRGITHDRARNAYLTRYASDAERLTEQIEAAAGDGRPRIVWVLQGPDAIAPDRVRRINSVYEERAAASGDLLADAGGAVSPASDRYAWTRYLPCTAYEREHSAYCTQPGQDRTALHRADDHLHFCLAPTTATPRPCPVPSPGIRRMAEAIARTVAEDAARR